MSLRWDKIKKSIKGELSDAAATTNKYMKIGKVKLDMANSTHSLNDVFKEIGMEVYGELANHQYGDIRKNVKIKNLIEKVDQLKQSIKEEAEKIDHLKS
ncbi:hypothetical protein JW777_09075 [bacterium]|nr:hypothetical protein [bacterium]